MFATILPAHFKQGICDLAEGAIFDGFHEGCEGVFVVNGRFLH